MPDQDEGHLRRSSDGGSRPVPDPTTLTTQSLNREIASLRELFDRLLEERDRALDARLRESEGAHQSIRELYDEKITAVRDLMDERFIANERQRLEQKHDTKEAVDAALIAQKEAVKEQTTASERAIAKSEAATNKQIEQLVTNFATEIGALRGSLDELKDREGSDVTALQRAITEAVSATNGVIQRGTGAKEDRASVYAVMALVASILLVAVGIAAYAGAHIH